MTHILVFAEQREGAFKKSAFEVLAAARALNATAVTGVTCGDNLDFAKNYGADKFIALQDPLFRLPTPDGYASVLTSVIAEIKPDVVLFPHSAMGRDLMPRVAAALDVSCISDATHLSIESGTLTATRFAHSGKTVKSLNLKQTPALVSLRPNAWAPAEEGTSELEIRDLNLDAAGAKVRVSEISKTSSKVDLSEADIVVSGGRGLKEPANFKLVEDFAAALGGAVGASRAVVDAGWRPHAEQVGQTGKVVSPNLYIACGISGAIQHLAGMSSSKVIVAINTDKDAPIFKLADYGIVGDALEILPKMTEVIKTG